MKFFYPLALALAAVVAAQDDQCDAANIVTACLDSETDKVSLETLLTSPFSRTTF